MPTFNSALYLVSTVESVLAQTYDGWQLVLCDDGSSDETIAVTEKLVAGDHRIRSVRCPHGGPAHARNTGLSSSDPRSEFVVFMDSDDTWEIDTLAVLLRALELEPDCVAAYGLARATDIDGHPYDDGDLVESMRSRSILRSGQYVELPGGSRTTFEAMLVKNCVVTPGTALIRRSALQDVGSLDPKTSPAEDWDLFVRLARRSDLVLVDHVVLNWRRHSDSLANTSRRWRWAYLLVRTRAIACSENTSSQRTASLEALLADCRSSLASVIRSARGLRLREACSEAAFVVLSYGAYGRFRLLRR
jgi:glycosyltransferase involved in cell wall biosynthesis